MCFNHQGTTYESIPVRRTGLQEWGISAIASLRSDRSKIIQVTAGISRFASLVEKLGLIKQRCIARMTGQMIHAGLSMHFQKDPLLIDCLSPIFIKRMSKSVIPCETLARMSGKSWALQQTPQKMMHPPHLQRVKRWGFILLNLLLLPGCGSKESSEPVSSEVITPSDEKMIDGLRSNPSLQQLAEQS